MYVSHEAIFLYVYGVHLGVPNYGFPLSRVSTGRDGTMIHQSLALTVLVRATHGIRKLH